MERDSITLEKQLCSRGFYQSDQGIYFVRYRHRIFPTVAPAPAFKGLKVMCPEFSALGRSLWGTVSALLPVYKIILDSRHFHSMEFKGYAPNVDLLYQMKLTFIFNL